MITCPTHLKCICSHVPSGGTREFLSPVGQARLVRQVEQSSPSSSSALSPGLVASPVHHGQRLPRPPRGAGVFVEATLIHRMVVATAKGSPVPYVRLLMPIGGRKHGGHAHAAWRSAGCRGCSRHNHAFLVAGGRSACAVGLYSHLWGLGCCMPRCWCSRARVEGL